MPKGIKIPKSAKTIDKEAKSTKIKMLKDKPNVTNEEIRDLLIEVLEKLDKEV